MTVRNVFVFSGYCEPANNPCDDNAACAQLDTDPGYICTCNTGYVGDGISCTGRLKAGPVCKKKVPNIKQARTKQYRVKLFYTIGINTQAWQGSMNKIVTRPSTIYYICQLLLLLLLLSCQHQFVRLFTATLFRKRSDRHTLFFFDSGFSDRPCSRVRLKKNSKQNRLEYQNGPGCVAVLLGSLWR